MYCALKENDLQIAINIASYAGVLVRDANGNLNTDVWCMSSDQSNIGRLIGPQQLQKIMLAQLQSHLEAQKELLLEIEEHDVVMKWIMEYVSSWENQYRYTIQQTFDISPSIRACMHEIYYEITPLLDMTILNTMTLRNSMKTAFEWAHEHLPEYTVLQRDQAIVRFMFRHPDLTDVMCRMAGKLMQKKEVCNRSGNYSSKIQRNDVTQEKDEAIASFVMFLESRNDVLQNIYKDLAPENVFNFIIDHKSVTDHECWQLQKSKSDLPMQA